MSGKVGQYVDRKLWAQLTLEQVVEQIHIRDSMLQQMVGSLYPSIVRDEMADLFELKAELEKPEAGRDEAGDAQAGGVEMAMKLTCSVCKFTLTPSTPEESAAYEANRPMHCATPMVGGDEGRPEVGENQRQRLPG